MSTQSGTGGRQRGSSIRRVTLKSGKVVWRFRLDAEPSSDGTRRQRTYTYPTEREAVEAQSSLREAVASGTWVDRSRLTVDEYLDGWLAANQAHWRPSTYVSYRGALQRAREAVGTKPLQSLRKADVEALKASVLGSGGRRKDGSTPRSPRTVALLLTILSKALDDAIREELIRVNPVRLVRKPAQRPREMQVWTAEQMGAFLAHVEDDDLAGAWHLSALGMRRGEVLGLRWSDVDLEAGVVHVRQSRVQAGRDVHTGDPKTDRGRRDVPLHPAAIAALRQTRARTLSEPTVVPLRQAHGGERVVVVDERGEALRPDRYSDLFAEHVRAAGLPAIRLHDMRHTAATVMLATGVPPVTVAGILGHSPDVLLRTYAHALPSAKRDAVNLLGGLYSSGT